MNSKHLIDPDLLAALETFPQFEFSSAVIPMMRTRMADMLTNMTIPDSPDVGTQEHKIASGKGAEVSVLVHTPRPPSTAPRAAVLHIHGGGYVIASAKMFIAANQQMALHTDCVVASVDYRLAPETTHPGPIDDCYTALKWLHDNAETLHIDRTRIAVTGESAGGGLAAALALLARDRGEVHIAHQHLISPMLDDRTCVRDTNPYAGEFVWTPGSNRFGWSSLLGCAPGSDGVSAYAAAARAKDLGGLPNAFIAVGALDLFAEENMEYARRLMRAGVSTELHVYPGAYHGFEFVAEAPVTHRANQISLAALRRALHRNQ